MHGTGTMRLPETCRRIHRQAFGCYHMACKSPEVHALCMLRATLSGAVVVGGEWVGMWGAQGFALVDHYDGKTCDINGRRAECGVGERFRWMLGDNNCLIRTALRGRFTVAKHSTVGGCDIRIVIELVITILQYALPTRKGVLRDETISPCPCSASSQHNSSSTQQ